MSVTLPAAHTVLDLGEIIGHVGFDEDPLGRILEMTNYLYAEGWTPPAVNFAAIGGAVGTPDLRFPFQASADTLDYTIRWQAYHSTNTAVTVRFYTASADTDTWTLHTSWTTAAWSGMSGWLGHTLTAVPADTIFGRLVLSATGTMQVHSVMIYPAVQTSLPTAVQASGWQVYDDGLLASSGGAINVEHVNRAISNVNSVLADRTAVIMSYVDDWSTATRFSTAAGVDVLPLFAVQPEIAGQAGATVTVRCRAADGGTAQVVVSEDGGDTVVLDADDVDQTATLTLRSDRPVLRGIVRPDLGTTVHYVTIDWTPGD